MKINVLYIVSAHLATLKTEEKGSLSKIDVCVFYLFPAVFSALAIYKADSFSNDIYVASITVFAIFAALLLNVQIAMFSIFQRTWNFSRDSIMQEAEAEEWNLRRALIREVNANISYLILVTCVALTMFLLFYGFTIPAVVKTALATYVYVHFLLTLIMIVKRAHALFHKEYEK